MPSAQLQTLIDVLRTNSPLSGNTIAEMRASMEAATTLMALPPEVTYEPVNADGVPAEWTVASGATADRAIVYFHGGGYCVCSIKTHRLLVAAISQATGARVLSVDYRLAPEHAFPAAVEDGVTAYRFARRNGIEPGRIALAGDSAGGGLTVATLLALRDAGDALPAAGVCLSPWLDLTLSGASMTANGIADPLVHKDRLQQMADAYLAGADARSPTASPLFANVRGLPPLLIHVGTAERLLDDSTRFAERARAAGVHVELEVWDDMIHVWHAFAFVLPEGQRAIDRIGEYVRAQFEGRGG
jgi:monoterpene epsilon-lactone hydrolase